MASRLNTTKAQMDEMVLRVVKARPGRRLSDIHYDNAVVGMSYQDTCSTLRRLEREGKVHAIMHYKGYFWYKTYTVTDAEASNEIR